MRTVAKGLALPILLLALTACTGEPEPAMPSHRVLQGGAPGQPAATLSAIPTMPEVKVTADDITFVRGMIEHHKQALAMTTLVPSRTSRSDVPLFAERIHLSQEGEIELMEQWLTDHRLEVLKLDSGHGSHQGMDHSTMPGMATPEQMAALEQATGAEFDRMFLQLMHTHHDGALKMVADLQAGEQSNEPILWGLVKDIDADQRIEMDRIQQMLQK